MKKKAKVVSIVCPGVLKVSIGENQFNAVTPINVAPPKEGDDVEVKFEKQGDAIVHAWHVPSEK